MRHLLSIVMLLFVAAAGAMAHIGGHGHAHVRTWHVGHRHIHASFHSLRGETVILEDRHGRLRSVRFDALSPADQTFASERITRIRALNTPQTVPAPTPAQRVQPPSVEPIGPTPMTIAFILLAALSFLAALRMPWALRMRTGTRFAATCVAIIGVACLMTPSVFAALKKIVLGTDPAVIDKTFEPFKPHVTTRHDATWYYVESDGMPVSMPAMKGITNWQQQVPVPQGYTGTNAWQIPLNPVVADTTISLHTSLHTGAVAVAANGLPIFNPENNRGEFSQDIGELDAFGGHCGRADDYHYHIAPTHLAAQLGSPIPIAWAFDGYPIYAFTEPDGSAVATLDEHLGHVWGTEYHYHAIKTKPYMIASLRGKVTIQNDQIMPQARTTPIRPAGTPLKGAVITDMRKCDAKHYVLKYTVNGKTNWVNYEWTDSNKYTFRFVKQDSGRTTSVYARK